MPAQDRSASNNCRADHHLEGAESEHQPARDPQALKRQLQADHKQQQHDAETSNGLDRLGALMVIAESHGRYGASEVRPNGPTAEPTSVKPSTWLNCSRWNTGMTTPAAPRTMSASL
jgi:hypothetical protein